MPALCSDNAGWRSLGKLHCPLRFSLHTRLIGSFFNHNETGSNLVFKFAVKVQNTIHCQKMILALAKATRKTVQE